MIRNGLAILAVLGFAALAQGVYPNKQTAGNLDHSASSESYVGDTFMIGWKGQAISKVYVGGNETPQPTDVNTAKSGTVNITLDPGNPPAELNLGLLIVGGAGGRQNAGTLKFTNTDVTIDATKIMFGYCYDKANRNPNAYVTFDRSSATINVTDFWHGWSGGDGSEARVRTAVLNGGTFILNVVNDIKQGYHTGLIQGTTGGSSEETIDNYINVNGASKATINVGGSWYLGTGRGGRGEFYSQTCTDLSVTIGGMLKLGGTNPDSTRTDSEWGVVKFGSKSSVGATGVNVTVADVYLNGAGHSVDDVTDAPSLLELHGTHMGITNSLRVDAGDTIALFYIGPDPYQTWLRMPDVGTNAADLTTMIADGRIVANTTGTPPAGALGVYLGGGFAYVGLMASAPASAIPGDADLNGYVDLPDLIALARNWKVTSATWGQGDFDGDKIVDLPDLIILARNWHAGTPPPAGASGEPGRTGAVPEPACLTLLAIGGLALMRRRPKV